MLGKSHSWWQDKLTTAYPLYSVVIIIIKNVVMKVPVVCLLLTFFSWDH